MRPFIPLVRNPHLLTILGNFWPRKFDFSRWPMESNYIRTDADTTVLVQTQRPEQPRAVVVSVHGLEGSGSAGYNVSLAHACLCAGFVMHRFHMRTCGGTAHLAKTLYHAGLTCDLRAFLTRREHDGLPVFLVGFSLGGNVVLKLAGEMGDTARDRIRGVCAVSTPIDLAACARRIGRRDNYLYERRFVRKMQERLIASGRFAADQFRGAKSIYAIDDVITAPSFGFGTANRYYESQSAQNFLDRIRVPALVIQAKDDTFIPFAIFDHAAFRSNPCVTLVATDYGGHLGFLQRRGRRFWLDEAIVEWIEARLASS